MNKKEEYFIDRKWEFMSNCIGGTYFSEETANIGSLFLVETLKFSES
ncbi:hypothetical protein [Bacillus cereus]|nr:hypothetical protein [Bacillus cereus]MDA2080584.1 hypothetical protein [Bacillus cereus]HEE9033810.1 hypothetical protein [Bacillus cereus]HEF1902584.1 hypothetical protein [Bacillus cereus]